MKAFIPEDAPNAFTELLDRMCDGYERLVDLIEEAATLMRGGGHILKDVRTSPPPGGTVQLIAWVGSRRWHLEDPQRERRSVCGVRMNTRPIERHGGRREESTCPQCLAGIPRWS